MNYILTHIHLKSLTKKAAYTNLTSCNFDFINDDV